VEGGASAYAQAGLHLAVGRKLPMPQQPLVPEPTPGREHGGLGVAKAVARQALRDALGASAPLAEVRPGTLSIDVRERAELRADHVALHAAKEAQVAAQRIALSAGGRIELRVGKSALIIEDGRITLEAERVRVRGRRALELGGRAVQVRGRRSLALRGEALDASGNKVRIEGTSIGMRARRDVRIKGGTISLN
jgi:hypothetical protein